MFLELAASVSTSALLHGGLRTKLLIGEDVCREALRFHLHLHSPDIASDLGACVALCRTRSCTREHRHACDVFAERWALIDRDYCAEPRCARCSGSFKAHVRLGDAAVCSPTRYAIRSS